ncbi:MAG: hypothetical protein F4Y04_07815 [Chloroflexi bacterium]|nr:hypothetical protein [Chloroflexota bacterium]
MAEGTALASYEGSRDLGSGRSVEEVVEMLVGRLESEANDRVSKKNIVELRWIEDLTQYEGRYGTGEESRLSSGGRSTAFVNETRPKTLACESKLYDLLFPTDDRNWGIRPTPVPELVREAENAILEAERLTDEANAAGEDRQAQALAAEAQGQADRAARAKAAMDEAKERADLMSDEIADHLVECDYPAECRDAIHDACVLGTGILKGPLARTERIRRNWLKNDKGEYELQFGEGADRLIVHRVSPWNLFPDPTALTFDDSEDWFERHLLKAKDLRRLARLPNVNVDAIEELLEEGPQGTVPTYVDQMQSISDEKMESNRQRYIFWEYRGSLDREEMGALFRLFGMEADMAMEEVSPLVTVDCVIWFCQGKAVRFALNHLDSNAAIYSFFTLEKNESRLWGVGIPWIMRQPQAIVNAAWRIMLDNAAIAAFPQTEVDTEVIEPAEGDDYGLRARKVWLRRSTAPADKPGLKFHEIPTRQQEMAAIIEIAKQFIDKETSISVIAEGEQGATTKTAGGMTLLMNAVNVVFRRIVKNFDDGITEPTLERAYDYLMQFSPKDEIKGDYQIQARGSSVLLVREIQAQNLLLLATQMIPHPILGKYFRALPILTKLAQSMMIPGEDVLKTAEEVAAEEAAEAENAGPDPAILQLEMQGELEQAKMQNAREIAMLEHEQAMMKLASDEQVKLEDIAARLAAIREQSAARLEGIRQQSASKERIFAGEAAMSAPGQPQGGGYL